jgi:hypothetical protein
MTIATHVAHAAQPWYREPWPWLLMAGPAAVVVAGVITAWIAVATNDGVVADDYYRRGLAINQTLARDAVAASHGYRASVQVSTVNGAVTTTLTGARRDGPLILHLAHPGRPALDRVVTLAQKADGAYAGELPALSPGQWGVTLEDPARSWRLAGRVVMPAGHRQLTVELEAR